MTLSPEQFNKLLIKEDVEKFVTKDEFNDKMDKILSILDSMSSDMQEIKNAQVLNIAAHDRFNKKEFPASLLRATLK